ncbi:MAG: hypothetical protein IJT94_00390, partial [Oscillibacter sp.]|nr:hypothetical protein [Oscillibacter sp.]
QTTPPAPPAGSDTPEANSSDSMEHYVGPQSGDTENVESVSALQNRDTQAGDSTEVPSGADDVAEMEAVPDEDTLPHMDADFDAEANPAEDWCAMEPEDIEERYADVLPAVERLVMAVTSLGMPSEPSVQDACQDTSAVQTSEKRKSEDVAIPEPEETDPDTHPAGMPRTAESVELRPALAGFADTGASRSALDFPSVLTQEVQTSENRNSAFPLFGSPDFPNSEANKNNISNNNFSNTESSIYPPAPAPTGWQTARTRSAGKMMRMDMCRERIRDNIDYSLLVMDHPRDIMQIDGYVELMAEVMASDRASWRINQAEIPTEQAARRFDTLNREHILYVKECLDNNTTQIANMRAYTLTALYNAPTTMQQYYASKVAHDMAQDQRDREAQDEKRRNAEIMRQYVWELHDSVSAYESV